MLGNLPSPMGHTYDLNMGSEILTLTGDIRSRSCPNIDDSYGTILNYQYSGFTFLKNSQDVFKKTSFTFISRKLAVDYTRYPITTSIYKIHIQNVFDPIVSKGERGKENLMYLELMWELSRRGRGHHKRGRIKRLSHFRRRWMLRMNV